MVERAHPLALRATGAPCLLRSPRQPHQTSQTERPPPPPPSLLFSSDFFSKLISLPPYPRSRESERSMSWRWALARRVAALAAGSGAGGSAQAQRLLTTSSGAGAALLGRQHLPLASQIRSKVHSPSQSPAVRLRPRCHCPRCVCVYADTCEVPREIVECS